MGPNLVFENLISESHTEWIQVLGKVEERHTRISSQRSTHFTPISMGGVTQPNFWITTLYIVSGTITIHGITYLSNNSFSFSFIFTDSLLSLF